MTTPEIDTHPQPEGDATPKAVALSLLTQASYDLSALCEPNPSAERFAMVASRVTAFAFAGRLLLSLEAADPQAAQAWAHLIQLASEGWGEGLDDIVSDGLELVGVDPEVVIAEYEALKAQPDPSATQEAS